jgi:hypothetical protein
LQALQVPLHWAAVSAQQTPSTQFFEAHEAAVAAEQPEPFGRGAELAMYCQISCGP